MDKYEYKLKTEQMLELMEDGAYDKAAETADEIDWKRVRNVTMLMNVGDIYEKNGEYQKSYRVLRIAYHRAEGSRKVLYRLCSLAIKTGNVDEAIDYYDDFMQIAPKDPNQYILRYQILRAQRAPVEQQIEALEEFKKAEYIEEWAYELAKLYQEAGMTAECLEECDDLILWFSEGQYVYKAMELKMQYKPLTPSQQEKYDKKNGRITAAETEEIPDLETYAEQQEAQGEPGAESTEEAVESTTDEEPVHDEAEQAADEKAGGKKIGDTMPLDEALKKLLGPKLESDITEITPGMIEEEEEEQADAAEMPEEEPEPDMEDLEEAIDEIESVVDLEMVNQIAEEKAMQESVSASAGAEETAPEAEEAAEAEAEAPSAEEDAEIIGDETAEEDEDMEIELADESLDLTEAEEFLEEADAEEMADDDLPEEDADQIEGQMSFADILSDWGEQMEESEILSAEDAESIEIEDAEDIIEEAEFAEAEEPEEDEPAGAEEPEEDESAGAEEPEEDESAGAEEPEKDESAGAEEPEEDETAEAEELDAAESEEMEELEDYGAEELEPAEGELEGDQEETDEAEEEIPEADREDLAEGENMEEKKTTEPILPPDIQRMIDEIEGVIPPEEPKPVKPKKTSDEPHENMGKVAEELRIDDELDADETEDYWDDDYDEPDSIYEEENAYEEYDEEEYDSADYAESGSEADGEYDGETPDFEEEFRVNPEHSAEPDDREIPDDNDDEMDILSATTPLSRKETAKMIATGKTSPLPLDEISDALSLGDTGFVVHGRYDLETQSGIGTRAGLTEEQKKLFSYFVPVRGMSEQLVDVLEQDKNCTNRRGTSRTGNLLIIGNKGNGKTVLAVDVVKAIQKQRNIRQGKVAIVTGEALNKKKIGDIFDKLYGGALIIEKAGKMNEKTVARLNKAMEKDTGELLIVLEEQRKPLDRLLSSNREFRRKFTSRLEVPIFINDELVTFGQTYAQENGYRIDEMGILALYSRIDSLQREDHAVTVAEVKEIMDEAIQHSQRASAKKLVRRVFGKNTDESDRILLSEKDFNI